MNQHLLPRNVTRIEKEETFHFSCHPSIGCFTDCCRQLELALTPYDILRLKKGCGLHSEEFLDRYVIMEQEDHETFPRFYLTMVDDGRASCVFVSDVGCTQYQDRPGACRAYPMGRASIRQTDNSMDAFFVLLRENHCHGFQEHQEHNALTYSTEQELPIYNRFNDAVATLLQHEQIRQGKQLSEQQREQFILALYNLDQFRPLLLAGKLPQTIPLDDTSKARLADDEALLLYAIEWLQKILFRN
ncbi:MAG: YkgJ family cysteine cluster protein [Proteobacteria bacterium]|jgi:Fe-S-cluster containining protein|nr:YkgJ family cysteine cluster protein [Desulfocapsa sp.]MBU3945117.1 YkgJ family cysteine cluster protein [Pseudomonadota bacterium]MCG2743170.1 YkgJ family cysteine cluster protein [Desulfobacteraceae bacterium]MDO8946799.1 YkgJ family cysteine cluster protein [Desulfocapsaceae bacterium]MBU3984591.1 YkgJ family cysteine cluster protein [Pseudomonadota bacterium]